MPIAMRVNIAMVYVFLYKNIPTTKYGKAITEKITCGVNTHKNDGSMTKLTIDVDINPIMESVFR